MGSRWVHGERHLPRYRERSRHRNAQLPRRLCRTISKSCSWPLGVLSVGSCATVKKRPVRLAVPPSTRSFQARGVEELPSCGERPKGGDPCGTTRDLRAGAEPAL